MLPYQKKAEELVRQMGFSRHKTLSIIGQIKTSSPEEVEKIINRLLQK